MQPGAYEAVRGGRPRAYVTSFRTGIYDDAWPLLYARATVLSVTEWMPIAGNI